MPPKNKTEPDPSAAVDAPMVDESGYATADEMATVLDTLAELSERVDAIERERAAGSPADDEIEARRRAAAARSDDPVFLATTGHGRRPRRESEGERQDKVVTENARRHMHEPAGDAAPTSMLAVGRAPDVGTGEPGEGAMEDPSSPRFDERGEHGESVASVERGDEPADENAEIK